MKFLSYDPIKYIAIGEFLDGHMPWEFDEVPNGVSNCFSCGLKLPYFVSNSLYEPVIVEDLTFYRANFCSRDCLKYHESLSQEQSKKKYRGGCQRIPLTPRQPLVYI